MTKVLKVSIEEYHKYKAVILDALADGRVELLVLKHGEFRKPENVIDGVGICTLDFVRQHGAETLQQAAKNPEIVKFSNDHKPQVSGFSYTLNSLGGYQADFGPDRLVDLSVKEGAVVPSFAFSYSKITELGFDPNVFDVVTLESLLPPSVPVDPAEVRGLVEEGSRYIDLSPTEASRQLFRELKLAAGETPFVIAVGPKDGEALRRLFKYSAETGYSVTVIVDRLIELADIFRDSDLDQDQDHKPKIPSP